MDSCRAFGPVAAPKGPDSGRLDPSQCRKERLITWHVAERSWAMHRGEIEVGPAWQRGGEARRGVSRA